MKKHSPKFPLFRWFCYLHYVENIEDDLLEHFEKRAAKMGLRIAKLFFLLAQYSATILKEIKDQRQSIQT